MIKKSKFGIIGSGSWATALAKILTDNGHVINWWVRSEKTAASLTTKGNNPGYLSAVFFDTGLLQLQTDIKTAFAQSDIIVLATPSAYLKEILSPLNASSFAGKKIISAVKGIVPDNNILLNDYLKNNFNLLPENYFSVMGPCHAEEVAAEKLSYLTFSGVDEIYAMEIASCFKTDYINNVVNDDVYGAQYAAILKNIYAVGAGMAYGLEYGDNFLSVLIANSADEMAGFLRKVGIHHIEVGVHHGEDPVTHKPKANYAASVYLGDLLVTCYSPHSRNRAFGTMVGKGYSVKMAQLEMNMVAEGYNASRCIYEINKTVKADMPIAATIYKILYENMKPADGFRKIEEVLV